MALAETRAVRTQSRRPQYFREVPYEHAELNARVLLRSIKAHLGETQYFQREDLLQLPVFTHISTISRYGHIRMAVLFLVEHGDLISLSRIDLAVPSKARNYTPVQQEYLETISSLVSAMPKRTPFTVMDVVEQWRADGHLSINSKRIAVRMSMAQLVREKVCKKRSTYEFTV